MERFTVYLDNCVKKEEEKQHFYIINYQTAIIKSLISGWEMPKLFFFVFY